ncbi:MAG TPA: NADP-dependent oxidoreductase [Caulobacteraceae bacterium]|jgi:NADPH:quinone reductase-like Zn-dependent oxidoreductase|nr:NADP-dependent oxidoreductase [Caulobacteraceae bacterium]
MRRIQYHRYGGAEELRLETVETPRPGPGQVRVQVKAAATNPADGKIRAGMLRLVSGSRFPRGLGHDFAGVVDAVGPGVTSHKPGDAVFGVSGIRNGGSFADYLIVPATAAYPKPGSLSFELASAVTMASVTAWSGIVDRARVAPGQSVFVTGCLGGVGRAAVQLARMRGAQVAGNCSAMGRAEAEALGVSEVADYHDFDPDRWRGRFHLVFDTAGGLTVRQCEAMLKPGGVAVHAVPSAAVALAMVLSRRHALASGNPDPRRMAGLTVAADEGWLAPKIARTVALAEAIPALVELEAGRLKGRVVIVP